MMIILHVLSNSRTVSWLGDGDEFDPDLVSESFAKHDRKWRVSLNFDN